MMARKVEVKLVDDLDGSQAVETVRFAVDGSSYEIDLSAKHATELRSALDDFIGSARRLGRSTANSARAGAAAPRRDKSAQNRAVRDWAKGRNIQLADRGRIPANIMEQYEASAGE
jgi:hypothetical protein